MSDLVERLREIRTAFGVPDTLCGDAANEIERLTRELSEWKRGSEHVNGKLLAEIGRLTAQLAEAKRELALAHKRMEYVAGELQAEGMYNLSDHLLQDDAALTGEDKP